MKPLESLELLHTMIAMLSTICIGGSILMFLRSNGERSKNWLALSMFLWGVIYLIRTVHDIVNGLYIVNFNNHIVLDPAFLAIGNFYLLLLMPYPIEVIRPGWLNIKRIALIFAPYLLIIAIYVTGLAVTGRRPMTIMDLDSFKDNISYFCVWYRLVILASAIIYECAILAFIYKYEKSYMDWCLNNFGTTKNFEITWLVGYAIFIFLIGLSYTWIAISGSITSSIVHKVFVMAFFCYALYNGLFHSNPYSEDFFSQTLDEKEARDKAFNDEDNLLMATTPDIIAVKDHDNDAFPGKIAEYKTMVEEWFQSEKPYLRSDFKLIDVRELLPLNRSYLSRIFNEGFGDSFSNIIKQLRIAEAERLLVSHPELPVNRIAEMTGFSSPSVFHRSFCASHNGKTPIMFRKGSTTDKS